MLILDLDLNKQLHNLIMLFIHFFFSLIIALVFLIFVSKGNRNVTVTSGLQFSTRKYHCLNELYHLFYKKIKIIPYNIYDLLTPIALAHWIMGDGAKRNKGLVLCTDSFSISDVVKLSNVLRIK